MRSKKTKIRRSGRNSTRLSISCSKNLVLKLLLLFVIFFISINCTGYNPAFYPSYDTLNPGPEVRKNPVAMVTVTAALAEVETFAYDAELITDQLLIDGKTYFVVDEYFMAHYKELWNEIEKMRME